MRTSRYSIRRIAFNVISFFVLLGVMGFVFSKTDNKAVYAVTALGLGLFWGWAEGRIFGDVDDTVDEKFWLQRADGTIEAVGEQSRAGVLQALKNFGWEGELEAEKKLGKKASVPPSLGLGQYGQGRFLNIMPRPAGKAHILYVRELTPEGGKRRKKGKPAVEEIYKENCDLKLAESLIHAYFAEDWKKIDKMLL